MYLAVRQSHVGIQENRFMEICPISNFINLQYLAQIYTQPFTYIVHDFLHDCLIYNTVYGLTR